MRWIFHGFNLFSVIAVGAFTIFGLGLAIATIGYRRWLGRNDPHRR